LWLLSVLVLFGFWGAVSVQSMTASDYDGGILFRAVTGTNAGLPIFGITSLGRMDLIGGATFDNYTSSSILAITEGTINLVGAVGITGATTIYGSPIGLGYDAGAAMSIATTDTTGVMAITHAGSGPTMSWTIPVWTFTNSTSNFTYTPDFRIGFDAGAYTKFAVSDTTGALAITHGGSGAAVTWTAPSLAFTGDFSSDGATAVLDGSTSARLLSAGFVSSEAPAVRFGVNATEYMNVAVTATTGAVAITHTGNNKKVTWTTTGGFDFVGDIELDGITQVGNVSMDGATMLFDGSTSVRGVSAGFTSLESPANRFGVNATEYMQIATTATSGVTAITHTGSAPTVTWTATSFSFVGPVDVGGFFDMGTMDVGIAVTTASPFAMEVHTEPLTTLVAGDTGLSAGIRSRYHVSVAQPNQISISAVESRLRVKHGLADGAHSAVSGVIEASGTSADFTGTATTQRAAGFFALDFDADVSLADDGWLTGVTINSSVNGAVSMAAVQFAGLRISTNSTCEAWEQGIVIDDNAAVVGLDIGTCTTDIALQNAATIVNGAADDLTLTEVNIILEGAAKTNSLTIDDGNEDVKIDSDNQTATLPTISIPDFVDATADFLVTNTFTTVLPFHGGLAGEDTDAVGTNGAGLVGGGAIDITTYDYNDGAAGANDVLVKVYDVGTTTWDDLKTAALLTAGADWAINYQLLPDADAEATGDAFAIGFDEKFCEFAFNDLATDAGAFATWGANGAKWQYSTGPGTWSDLTVYDGTDSTAQDGLRPLQRPGAVSFVPPANWVVATYDGEEAYWVQCVITDAQLTQTPVIDTTNHDEPLIPFPTDGLPAPFKLEITKVRVANMHSTVHDQAIAFIVGNFTDGEFSAAQTWTASQYCDTFTLASAIAADPGDVIGILCTNDNGSTANPVWAAEFTVTYED
jgi:hypothetical protein